MRKVASSFHILFLLLLIHSALPQYVPQPTRPIDLFHPFGTPTERPKNHVMNNDEAIVRLPIGDIIGKSVVLKDLPWTADQDPSEQIPPDRTYAEPSPLPPKNNVTIYTFLGVPYAEPPVSQRRFKPPQQLTVFPGQLPFLAFNFGASCPQDTEYRPQPFVVMDPYPFLVDEDCLYLNIYTPTVSTSSPRSYPVLVFFHGGNFQTGSASEWPAHGLASRGMVVVTVNYRLGAFGFMSLGDADSSNRGLQDQRMALRFVQEHISAFGGDPQAVTAVGHDAGGVSVGLHMITPLSKDLFRAAASMSGAELSYHSTIGKPALAYNNTIKLGRYLGCTQSVPMHVWDCILTRSTDDIVRATTTIPIEYNRYLFMPNVEGRELPGNPYWILLNAPSGTIPNIASPVPYLTGINAQDGSEVILEDRYLGEFNDFQNVDSEYMRSWAIEYAFRHNYSMNREAIVEAMIDKYTFWPDVADVWAIRESFIQMTTDAYYTAPVALSAHLHSAAGSRVFMYVNNYNFSRGNEAMRFIPDWMGVCRECDLYLMFCYAFMPPELRPYHLKDVNFTESDRNASQLFSNIMRRYVANQNPNFLYDGSWSAHQPRRHWYLDFNYTWETTEMRSPGKVYRDYRYQDVAFWNEYIPALVNYMTTTFPPFVVSERRTTVVFQWITGVCIVLLMIAIVIAGTCAYKNYEYNRLPKDEEERERHQLVNFASSSSVETARIHRSR